MNKVLVLNGPNLNLLGVREPDVYGSATLADVEGNCRALAGQNLALEFKQSNFEGQLVEWIHEARETTNALIINPGAYSHTSIAIYDALAAYDGHILEVHVSNIHARESFRHHSYVSTLADGVVVGRGINGYELAMRQAASLLGVTL